jgi:hypothetical protein
MTYNWTSELWEYPGEGGNWYFITLPKDSSEEILDITAEGRKGFGSVRVRVTVGQSTWSTSIFPDSKSGCYMLPVKKDVRVKEHLTAGQAVDVTLEVLGFE